MQIIHLLLASVGRGFDRLLDLAEGVVCAVAVGAAWFLLPLMVFVRCYEIVARKLGEAPSNYFQTVEWAAFYLLIVLGIGYAYLRDAHVRVDLLRGRMSPRLRSWVEIGGCCLALVPVCVVIIGFGVEMAITSYNDRERAWVLLGAEARWLFRGALPFGFFLLLLAGAAVISRELWRLDRPHQEPREVAARADPADAGD